MKVLFLDIDGVLNSHRTAIAFGGYPHDVTGEERDRFDEVGLALIRGIVKEAKAEVVLSSSWRIGMSYEHIGTCLGLPIIGATPQKWSNEQVRGHEIAEWLDAHPEVECYVIVDDDSDMLPEQMERFVHTSGFDGFRWKDAERMAELFGIAIYDVNRPPRTAWEMA
jgi:hypothetical protein